MWHAQVYLLARAAVLAPDRRIVGDSWARMRAIWRQRRVPSVWRGDCGQIW